MCREQRRKGRLLKMTTVRSTATTASYVLVTTNRQFFRRKNNRMIVFVGYFKDRPTWHVVTWWQVFINLPFRRCMRAKDGLYKRNPTRAICTDFRPWRPFIQQHKYWPCCADLASFCCMQQSVVQYRNVRKSRRDREQSTKKSGKIKHARPYDSASAICRKTSGTCSYSSLSYKRSRHRLSSIIGSGL